MSIADVGLKRRVRGVRCRVLGVSCQEWQSIGGTRSQKPLSDQIGQRYPLVPEAWTSSWGLTGTMRATPDSAIEGVNFGKKWKHYVRNAQQYLKRHGQVQFDGARWRLVSPT